MRLISSGILDGTIPGMIDWDDAFDNSGYVADSQLLAERWAAAAAESRAFWSARKQARIDLQYADSARTQLDLFIPPAAPTGLIVFVHGGYWHLLDKSYWSQLATAALAAGWACAIPSYPLAPDARIGEITQAVAAAIEFAATLIDGPIRLVGHSAGGHLITRMGCGNSPLDARTLSRISKIVAVSGVYDLRPLLHTRMNDTLRLDTDEAVAESPALLDPSLDIDFCFWVGAGERPEFLRQTRAICETWSRVQARVHDVYEPGKHHFSVIESLADRESALFRELIV